MAHSLDARTPTNASNGSASLWKWGAGAAGAAMLAGLAAFNHSRARRSEAANPPLGDFLELDGVRLHYLDRGEGPPIVLLHGNGTMIEDWLVSGVFDALARSHRVIAFDRPGFGHTTRPRTTIWTPRAQAALLAKAFEALKLEAPAVVGHSFGTQVAMALALDHPAIVSRLVLLGGYFFPSARADVLVASQPAIPVWGDLMRYTVSPLAGAAMLPRINDKLFSPAPVPERWEEEFPLGMTLRPWQLRAAAAEAAMMIPAAHALSKRYTALRVPVTILAGSGDRIVDMEDQSRRLHRILAGSRFVEVAGAGHMVHHSATDQNVAAIAGPAADGQR